MREQYFTFKTISSLFTLSLLLIGCELTTEIQQEEISGTEQDILIENSLTFYEDKPFSELPIVQIAERLNNNLSEIYDGFSGTWFDPEKEEMVIALVEKEELVNQRENILNQMRSHISERTELTNIQITDQTFRTKKD